MARIVFGNHPFTEGPKLQPMCIRRDKVGYFTYPDFEIGTSDLNNLYISTPELTLGYFELAPGSKFSPPDHHPGDECYFVLEGELTEVNPISGQAVRIQENEVLLIPYGAVHGGYNFGTKTMKAVFALAPNMVSEQTFPTDMTGKWRVLKGKDEGSYKVHPDWDEPQIHGTISHLGRWPVEGKEIRKEPKFLYRVGEEKKLSVVNGLEDPYLMKFAVSNELIHFGELILPAGGKGCRVSEPESHDGEAAIFVAEGALSFIALESRETFKVEKDEVMFIPRGVKYQMMNYWAEPARAIFAIAPKL